MTTAAYYWNLYDAWNISLDYGLVFKRFQYGVSLERGPFDKRTADYVWMFIFGALSLLVISAVPYLRYPFMGISLVFMIVYVWSREFPNARINIYGVVSLKGFYLPWALLGLDLIFGSPIKPDIVGMVAGHLYYFLTVLHPLAGGKFKFKTPLWVQKIVAYWGEGTQINSPVQSNPSAGIVFKGRSHRLGGTERSTARDSEEQTEGNASSSSSSSSPQQHSQSNGVAFRGKSYRLNE
ncbi:unnamed protein product [Sphenostylis stenocarpa]|uniref:Derlin n=1 Tax=Sphenostylis stenocarpa TaxID=92480 RepID=A0AA86VMJ4_9FABA|nr:unnamed protein product [Sphenostylis stenocarpa]